MKLLKSYKLILACALLAGTGVGLSTTLAETAIGVEAATTGEYKYYIEGTVSVPGEDTEIGWSNAPDGTGIPGLYQATWKDDSSVFNNADGYWEVSFDADKGDMFKIVVYYTEWNSIWEVPWVYSGFEGATSYFSEEANAANREQAAVIVNESGTYTIKIHDGYAGYDDKSYGLSISGTVEEVKHTVTVYNGSEVLATETVADGTHYNPGYYFVEDHVLNGWFLDPSFETAYTDDYLIHDDVSIYGKWDPANKADYWIYVETYTSNILDHVFYWQSTNDASKVAWDGEGVQIAQPVPLTPATPEGRVIYGIQIKVEYQADKILFHNGNGGYGDQTIDLDLPGEPTIYWVGEKAGTTRRIDGGIFADNDPWVEALAFLDYWSTIRIDNDVYGDKTYNNSICHLLTDTEAWDELNGRYTALSADSKGLVDPVTDVEGWTVGQTMEYLTNAHSEPAAGPAASIFFSEPENVAGITAGALVLVSILGFSVFYFVRRRKHASN